MKFFDGCTALITGASSGLGREFARQLAPHARALVLTARRMDRLEELKTMLTHACPNLSVYCYGLDLTDAGAIERFTRWLSDEGIHPNFLVNNAGLGDMGQFETSEWPRVKAMLDVNVVALTKLTHTLLPELREFENAAILNVSSTASFLPLQGFAVYAATKAYVTSFSEALRAELRGTGVSVTTLCPGPVATEFGEVASREGEGRDFAPPAFFMVPADQVVYEALEAVIADRARVIPGWAVFLGMTFLASIPLFLLRLGLNAGAARSRREAKRNIATAERVH